MKDVIFALPGIALTIICWGTYGSVLHRGQALLGDRLKPLMCVGLAYFVFAIILPAVILSSTGKLGGNWSFGGVSWSTIAGACGAFGALGIILALSSGGKPIYVMPLVFGGAPIVNVLVSMYFQGLKPRDIGPFFLAGVIMVAMGAGLVLIFAPKAPAKSQVHAAQPKTVAARGADAPAAPGPSAQAPPANIPSASDASASATDTDQDAENRGSN